MPVYRTSKCPHCGSVLESMRQTGLGDYEDQFGQAVIECPQCHGLIKTGRNQWENMTATQRTVASGQLVGAMVGCAIVLGLLGGLIGALVSDGNRGVVVAGMFFGGIVGGIVMAVVHANRFAGLVQQSQRPTDRHADNKRE